MTEVNWDIAPKDATHHGFVNNPEVIAWYKHEKQSHDASRWSFWYSDKGILDTSGWCPLAVGERPLTLPLTPRPEYVAPPITKVPDWVPGVTLPPIGTICEFAKNHRAEHSSYWKRDILEGTKVEIIAHFMNHNFHVAAYIHDDGYGNKYVRQAVAEAFRPFKSEEEIAAEKRQVYIDKLMNELGYTDGSVREIIENLYDKGILGE